MVRDIGLEDNERGSLPIVGIGASAGGLAALQRLFDRLPKDTGAAFVVVQHLSPDFKSLMDEILARHTGMPVVRVDQDRDIQPDTVYLLQPGHVLHVEPGRIHPEPRHDAAGTVPHPVDTLFDTMASAYGASSIAVVLSGTGTDGSRGVRRVKEVGGVVLVQDLATAEFDGMPNAALATGCTDIAIPPDEIAATIERLVKHRGPLRSEDVTPEKGTPYQRILELVKEREGYDLTAYKSGTIGRRIQRRMALHHVDDTVRYVAMLETNQGEVTQLARDCLIHVTFFFRDAASFANLEKSVREAIAADPDRRDPYRVWVAGCSTGEEAYSIASIVDRAIRDQGLQIDYKVFATDLDEGALQVASAGRYPLAAQVDIPAPHANLLVRDNDDSLVVAPSIRNRVVFANHDVLKDPPFPRADLVTCRNLLIYLRSRAQSAVLKRFLFSLKRGGLLFLGASETSDALEDEVVAVSAKDRIYRKTTEKTPVLFDVGPVTPQQSRPARRVPLVEDQVLTRACQRLVTLFGASGAVVLSTGEVAYSFGDIGRWLTIPSGSMTTHLEDLLPEPAKANVGLALRQARSSGESVKIKGVESRDASESAFVEIVHVPGQDHAPACDVLLFSTVDSAVPAAVQSAAYEIDLDEASRDHIEALERELGETRQNLQASIEELETTNEELQSVNEELLASNEELQSTNEELHSVNEELYTVNSEHQQKIGELVDVTEDLEHLLQATNIGTLFLDKTLTIRRFTASVKTAIPLRDQDIGRSLRDLQTHLVDSDLPELVQTVIDEGKPADERYLTKNDIPMLVSVHPYRRGSAGGAVLTFVDVGRLEVGGEMSTGEARLFDAICRLSRDVLWVADAETLQVRFVTASYDSVWGATSQQCMEEPLAWMRQVHPDDRDRVERNYIDQARSGDYDCEYRIVRPDGEIRWIRDRGFGTTRNGTESLVVGVAEDVTERVTAERERHREVALHRTVCSKSSVPMLFLREDGRVFWHNMAAATLFGTEPGTLNLSARFETDAERDGWRAILGDLCRGKRQRGDREVSLLCEAETRRTCRLDAVVAGEDGAAPFVVCQIIDLTHYVSRAQELAAQAQVAEAEALRDPLTGLHNRRGADRWITESLLADRRQHAPAMAILVDCDRFKTFNDGHGYAAGDAVLRAIAGRMRECLRPEDLAARVGGDEFLVVLRATRLAEAAHVGDKLRRVVSDEPVEHEGVGLEVTVSVGVVPVPEEHVTAGVLVAEAGQLLQRSKSMGRNRVSFADGKESALPSLTAALDELLEGDRVRAVRQTLNDTDSGEVVGYELLSRGPEPWQQPSVLFDLFRRHDRIEEVDVKCLEVCLGSVSDLDGDQRCHVNLLPSSLLNGHWEAIRELLASVSDTSRLCLELSEQQFVGPSARLRSRLGELRDLGVQVALDDVGFGRSALETLLAVEPEVVKIDRGMVHGVDLHAGRRRDLSRLVDLLGGLQCDLVAEGVETEGQCEVLRDLGVRYAQGFLWSNPDSAA